MCYITAGNVQIVKPVQFENISLFRCSNEKEPLKQSAARSYFWKVKTSGSPLHYCEQMQSGPYNKHKWQDTD